MQFWKTALVKLQMVKVIVLNVKDLKANQIKEL